MNFAMACKAAAEAATRRSRDDANDTGTATLAQQAQHEGERQLGERAALAASSERSAPIVVVGNGPAGVRVVKELAQRQCPAPIVLYGAEACEPYNRVRLSSFLAGEADWSALTRDAQLPAAANLEQRLGCAIRSIDRDRAIVRDAAGREQAYSALVLATGSRPHIPQIPNIALPGVFTFRDLADAQLLCARRARSRRTVVLGGGLLGLEAARAMCRFHTEVIVIEHLPRLMPRQLDDEASALLLAHIASMHIEVKLGEAVRSVCGTARVEGIELRSGVRIACDTLIVATGIRPNVELARAAGLSVGRGIRVSDSMQTSDPRIYAAGECAEHRERVYGLVAPGLEQAAVAAHCLSGGHATYAPSATATRLKVGGLPVFSMGRVGEDDKLDLASASSWRSGEGAYRKIFVERGRLIGAIAVGEAPDLGRMQEALTHRRLVPPWQAWRFRRTGSLWSGGKPQSVCAWPASTTVCNCTGVTRGRLGAAIAAGCASVDALAGATGASTVCGSCRGLLAELLGGSARLDPVAWHRLVLGIALFVSIAAALFFGAPALPYARSVQASWIWDALWRDGGWKQASGFSLLGLTLVALTLSLRKRWPRLRLGGFDGWRAVHAALGIAIALALVAHTGGRLGSQLNAMLAASFAGLLLAGALAAGVVSRAHRMEAARARRVRSALTWAHILLFWPVPVLLGFHVFKTYYYSPGEHWPMRRLLWLVWLLVSLVIAGYLALGIGRADAAKSPWLARARLLLLPGQTTGGHYQIELKCESCHGGAFTSREAMQQSCVRCHGAELEAANDTHPLSKFTDPRNADRLEKLDATLCVTCHVEHRPHVAHAMGVTLPPDLCFHCHSEIAAERPSHAGMGFETCGSAGCHKYHDNRALYEDFLARHLDQPVNLSRQANPERGLRRAFAAGLTAYPAERFPLRPATSADAPSDVRASPQIVSDWLATAHARSGVNCSACHQPPASAWVQRPNEQVCAQCHDAETKGFLAGKHGMRLSEELPPLTPAQARLPMHARAADKPLGCTTCHGAHRFDTRSAAVDACTGCHADRHTQAYRDSAHHELWRRESAGAAPAGSGVSCATCHLPRIHHRGPEGRRILVQHNQNDNLRPNEKMLRTACMNCHGLGFSIDALADEALIAANFRGRPLSHVRSLDMVAQRLMELEDKRGARREAPN
jgi:nitrite reductase (NADH) large subunit